MTIILGLVVIIFGIGMIGVGGAYGFRWLMEYVSERVERSNRNLAELQNRVMLQTAAIVKDTTSDVVNSTMKLYAGEVNTAVPQPDNSEQTMHPSWMTWYEENMEKMEEAGVGDSVWFNRENGERTIMIEDGESIIPGVPRPDMSGEEYSGPTG